MSSLFGSTLGTTAQQPQQSTGLFGSLGTNTAAQSQQSGGLFGGQNNQTGGGLFGSSGQTQQTGGSSLFGNTQNNQQNQGGGLFASMGQNNNQQGGSAFGGFGQNQQQQNQQQNQTQGGLFGNSLQQQQQPSGMFSGSTQNNGMTQNQQGQLGSSMWIPNSGINPREKSVQEQMQLVLEKWEPQNPNCVFKYYFYNKVGEERAPFYRPSPNEDPKAWEDALSKKPGPGFIPVLCTGFEQMGERIKTQQRHIAEYNRRLHEINNCLTQMLQIHDTKTSIRAMDAKRKHVVLKNRCLALATKVQILRNRGYAMGGDEEDLREKLQSLDRSVCDPGLGARAEEIWARMISVQERARLLQRELDKSGAESHAILDEEMSKRAKKILEDYQTQLIHLKKEMDAIQEDYLEWEKEQGPPAKKAAIR
ncbi:hypothetical protein BP5796_09672 [Coleophoma crateriformis]|uniref:Nucleoporin Nup54 alpha-helical domain-containing protein n=1 Tax=Coleophoma crateriformis TaxID=565419 RepID=A0A3D8QYM0_9HELO|nr:hypothetical protein BP5796_09672 [Coleophoma crateriformis]